MRTPKAALEGGRVGEGSVSTCSPFYEGHVVEVSVLSQASLYDVLSVGQLLRGESSRAVSGCQHRMGAGGDTASRLAPTA